MHSVKLIPLLAGLAFLSSCITQQVDPTADLPNISYQTDISPIISANCAYSGCHDGGGNELFSLATYDELIRHSGVKAGKPHDSRLYDVIRQYTGESAMPPSPNEPLSDEQIATIYVWILQGAKNN